MKELYLGDEGKLKLLEGIFKLSKAVLSTMGPMGKTVILQDPDMQPYITKDGVSVANAIRFMDQVEDMGAKLIKEVAQKTADQAGDGTTTSICLAIAFIKYGLEVIEKYKISNVELNKRIDKLVLDLLKGLEITKQTLEREDINKVATISANGDTQIGELVQAAYDFSDVINIEEGTLPVDEIELVAGMVYESTYMSPRFITNEKRKEVDFKECKVLLLDKKMESLEPYREILTHCANNNVPLLIVAEFISETVLKLLEANVINEYVKLAAIKTPGFGKYRKDHLTDMATVTGARIVTNDKGITPTSLYLGDARNLVVSKYRTVFAGTTHPTARIEELEEQLTIETVDYEKTVLKSRIENLNSKLSIVKVGGTSEVEMKERKDRIEDAVLAVKSALEEGIVEGGGNALLRAGASLEIKDGVDAVLALVAAEPAQTIAKNSDGAIPVSLDTDYFKQNVIDPYKVTRCSLQNAASVAKSILSTEAVVLNQHLWK